MWQHWDDLTFLQSVTQKWLSLVPLWCTHQNCVEQLNEQDCLVSFLVIKSDVRKMHDWVSFEVNTPMQSMKNEVVTIFLTVVGDMEVKLKIL